MWQILKERLDLTTSYIGRTAIVAQFQNARPITGESISVYVARLQVFQLQLQGSTEEITEQASTLVVVEAVEAVEVVEVVVADQVVKVVAAVEVEADTVEKGR